MSDYPGAIHIPRLKENKLGVIYDPTATTRQYAEDHKKLDDEVVAIETELGLNPRGEYDNVAARIQAIIDSIPDFIDKITFDDINIRTLIGHQAGKYDLGQNNTYFGYQAGSADDDTGKNNEADNNVALGYRALYKNRKGYNNTAEGAEALRDNTLGNWNTAQGRLALASNTEGGLNTAQGAMALRDNTIGQQNTAQGMITLVSNTEGNWNTAQGAYTMVQNTTGSENSAQGYQALYLNDTGNCNSAQGVSALQYNVIGNNNTAQGYTAGALDKDQGGRTKGNDSVYLGAHTKTKIEGSNNEIVIGYNAVGEGSNSAVYGNSEITKHIFPAGDMGLGTAEPTAKLDVNADKIRIRTAKTPASASAAGNAGDICWDDDYIYTCVATNTWKRAEIVIW